jgi:hypothetical protein
VLVKPYWGDLTDITWVKYSDTATTGTNLTNHINSVNNQNTTKADTVCYFEGDLITQAIIGSKGMVVKIEYSEGDPETISGNDIWTRFTIDPPDFRFNSSGAYDYNLYLKKGFTNKNAVGSSSLSAAFKGPGDAKATTGGYAHGGGYVVKIGGAASGISDLAIGAPAASRITEWYEDDFVFKGPATLLVYYDRDTPVGSASFSWGTNSVPGYISSAGIASYPNPIRNYNLAKVNNVDTVVPRQVPINSSHNYKAEATGVTSGLANLKVEYGTHSANFDVLTLLKVDKIALTTVPQFKEQVVFDDPRLFGPATSPLTQDLINAHWLSKIQDAVLQVTYKGGAAGKQRTIGMTEAYNNALHTTSSPNFLALPDATNLTRAALGFKYFGAETVYDLFVFNSLVSISVKGSTAATPIMSYSSATGINQVHKDFMNMIKVSAIYQCGKNGVTLEREDAWRLTQEFTPNNASCSSVFSSNVDPAFCRRASASFSNGGKLTKATVTLRPSNGSAAKTASIEIGAVGYQ